MKLKPKDIKKYNKLSKKNPIMVRVGTKWYTWSEGDPKYGVFLTTQSGRDVEFDFKQIDDIQEGVEKLKEKVVKLADGSYDVKKAKFKLLQRVSKRGLEGIVFLGAGGKLNQWVKGINDLWNKEKIGKGLIEDKMMGLYVINTTGGRTDLVMIFKTKSQLDIGKLAMWRLKFGDATWLSDYVVNYRDQHESVKESIMKLTKSKLKEMVKEELLKEAPKGSALWQKVVDKKVAAFVGLGKVNISISVEVGPLHKQADKYAYRIKWELYGADTKEVPLIFSDKLYGSADEAIRAGMKHYKKLRSKFRLST